MYKGKKGDFSAGVGSENRATLFVTENFPLNGLPLSRSICPVLASEIKHYGSPIAPFPFVIKSDDHAIT